MKPQELENRLIEFAVAIMDVTEALPNTKAGTHIAGQLIRSGTSPAPNYGEAGSAESRKDLIHKMKISLKELRETMIWLKNDFAQTNGRGRMRRCCHLGVRRADFHLCEEHKNRRWWLTTQKSTIVIHQSLIHPPGVPSSERVGRFTRSESTHLPPVQACQAGGLPR